MTDFFSNNYTDLEDTKLVQLSIDGNKKALQTLIIRHQLFVYNLALKMVGNVEDAEDLTQEVFIKIITALSKFEGKSKFRTWLYRITVNHFLNNKKKKSKIKTVNFETYFNSIYAIPSIDLNDQEEKEFKDTIEEIRINCTTGMLLCLSKEQRIIYILGEMFDIDHNLGAEILGITPGNFRIKLMRTRKELYNWMNKKCGLVNTNNPCRCSKKQEVI
ncbi:RNA polymerase sigma factor [Polaribacter vadi]|uniref:RNA polymerase sigma factor n=1 Tax=Polaribacter TaxID=52959 RepID=UPI001C093FAF|nr:MULTISPECIES: RNA polymerase sigma factor [Polaribacter]MBU3012694.1 RNA polymerase sigma factor [Polaribacter vadi]MDO6742511.1 RNA polymerase sigma factor [Polaribacter sp. 1_MG-2023]